MQEVHILLVHEEGASREGGAVMANYLTQRFGGDDNTIQRDEWAAMESMSMNQLALLAKFDGDLDGEIQHGDLVAKLGAPEANRIFDALGLGYSEAIGAAKLGEFQREAKLIVFAGEVHNLDDVGAQSGGQSDTRLPLSAIILWLLQSAGAESSEALDQEGVTALLEQLGAPSEYSDDLVSLASVIKPTGLVELSQEQVNVLVNVVGLDESMFPAFPNNSGRDAVVEMDAGELMRELVKSYDSTKEGPFAFYGDNEESTAGTKSEGNDGETASNTPAGGVDTSTPGGKVFEQLGRESGDYLGAGSIKYASDLTTEEAKWLVGLDPLNNGLENDALSIDEINALVGLGVIEVSDDGKISLATTSSVVGGSRGAGASKDDPTVTGADAGTATGTETVLKYAKVLQEHFGVIDAYGETNDLINKSQLEVFAAATGSMDDSKLQAAAEFFINNEGFLNQLLKINPDQPNLIHVNDVESFINLYDPDLKTHDVPNTYGEAAEIILEYYNVYDSDGEVGIKRDDLHAIANDDDYPEFLREAAKLVGEGPIFNILDNVARGDEAFSVFALRNFINEPNYAEIRQLDPDSTVETYTGGDRHELAVLLYKYFDLFISTVDDPTNGHGTPGIGSDALDAFIALEGDSNVPQFLIDAAKDLKENPLTFNIFDGYNDFTGSDKRGGFILKYEISGYVNDNNLI